MSRSPFIESLEPRRMLAFVVGTDGPDVIIIRAGGTNWEVDVNGDVSQPFGAVLELDAKGGDDQIVVESVPIGASATLYGSEGADVLTNGSNRYLQSYNGIESFVFDGGGESDTIIADNRADVQGRFYSMSGGGVSIANSPSGPFFLCVSGTSVESIRLRDSDLPGTIHFSAPAGKQLIIEGNGGADFITNAFLGGSTIGNLPEAISGSVSIDGGGGNDELELSNSINNVSNPFGQYTIVSNTVQPFQGGLPRGVLTHTTVESFGLLGSPGTDLITFHSTPSTVQTTIDSGIGNDAFIVGGGDWDNNGFLLSNTTLLGGAGADSIEFQDGDDSFGDTYTWAASSIAKTTIAGTFGFNISSIENRTLLPANFPTINAFFNTINLDSFASDAVSTTITGGRPCVVNLTLANLIGLLSTNLGGSSTNQLNIDDLVAGGPANGYQVSPTFVRKNNTNQTINYSGVGRITLNTSGVFDAVNVTGTGTGTALILNTNAGDDLINVGSGNLDVDFGGPVTVNGGTGLNDVNVGNALDTTLETMTLNGGTLFDGFSHTFSSVDDFTISTGPGGTNMTVNSVTFRTRVTGGSGNDTFTVGGGNIAANFSANINLIPFFDGGGGTDAIILDDRNGPATGSGYEFQRPFGIDRLSRGFGGTYIINWANMESATLEASDAPTTGTTTSVVFAFQSLTPLRINGNGGSDLVFVMDTAHPVFVNTGTGDHDQIDVNLSGGAPATAIIDEDDEVNGLMVRPGGTLRVASGATLAKSQVSGVSNYFDLTGTLDLAGGALLSRAGGPTLTQFGNQIIAGRNGGAWNGTSANGAINSSLAAGSALSDGVGHGLGSQIAPTMIGPFSIASGDTLVRYTLDGDANHDGTVDVADLGILASNWQQSQRTFAEGNFDYSTDGLVGVNDLGMLATNWQQSSPAAASTAVSRSPRRSLRLADLIDFA